MHDNNPAMNYVAANNGTAPFTKTMSLVALFGAADYHLQLTNIRNRSASPGYDAM